MRLLLTARFVVRTSVVASPATKPLRFNSFKMASTNAIRKGLCLGIYTDVNDSDKKAALTAENLTQHAKLFNDKAKNTIIDQLSRTEPLKSGKHRILYGVSSDFDAVAVVGLDKRGLGIDCAEQIHQGRETVRSAIAAGVSALRGVGIRSISVDPCGYADAAAEGGALTLFSYDELKSKEDARKPKVDLVLYNEGHNDGATEDAWHRGIVLGESQNFVRRLQETPANLLTPTRFGDVAVEVLKEFKNVEVIVHNRDWATEKKMFSFLSVSQGSHQPPKFVEIRAKFSKKSENAPVVLVGKGVCFDSGGISLKPSANMDKMRADMTGAAIVLSTIHALCRLDVQLPYDVIGLIPLVENLPGGAATKPGDVFFAMNGKSIKVDNTDAEGRLILADALCYADTFKPAHVIDIATLTGAMHVALGTGCTGVFCSSDELWKKLFEAGVQTGDRVWRMPLFKTYGNKMKTETADLNNISGPAAGAGSCVAAGFLREFVECKSWAHIDIAGVALGGDDDMGYAGKGMTGRPLRTLVNCVESL